MEQYYNTELPCEADMADTFSSLSKKNNKGRSRKVTGGKTMLEQKGLLEETSSAR
jgi:hypothetical protein